MGSSKEPLFVGAWMMGGAVAFFFIAPLFYLFSVIGLGMGLIVLAFEIESDGAPWPNGSRTSKGLVVAGGACVLAKTWRLFSPLWS